MKLVRFVVWFTVGLLPASVAAQSATSSAIAGVVRDGTGAVLPGVTVEASSPALIEKVRSVVTDGEGNYKILDLRPGTYAVTFSLTGFNAVKREGVELTTGFTATVNGELRVGDIQETVTVSGQSPVVDVQNSRVQNVLSNQLLQSTPSGGQAIYSYMAMTVGVVPAQNTGQDVGGNLGSFGGSPSYHGISSADAKLKIDGMDFNTLQGAAGGSNRFHHANALAYSEVNMGLSGQTAEFETGGVFTNFVPKEGGNRFTVTGAVSYANTDLQSSNYSSDLQARGLRTPGGIDHVWDYGAAFGGPLVQDKLWFFVAPRYWGSYNIISGSFFNATAHTPLYTPDLSRPVIQQIYDKDIPVRFTWQVNPTHKVAVSHSEQWNCFCYQGPASNVSPEATPSAYYRPGLTQAAWTHTASNRLLMEAGMSYTHNHGDIKPTEGVLPTDISTIDSGLGITYGSFASAVQNFSSQNPLYGDGLKTDPLVMRFALSYVTGSHAFKVGVTQLEGWHDWNVHINQSLQYTFLNRRPISLTQFADPFSQAIRIRSTGIYAQDQWTMRRLTLSLGARFDRFNGWVVAHDQPAGTFVPARSFAEVGDVPNFKDIDPRLGAAYDLFGNGKTAIKASFGRYVGSLGSDLTEQNNPALTLVTNTTRTWTDANGNYVPDCVLTNFTANGECGAINNSRFGTLVPGTTIADDVLRGWGKRWYNWQTSVGVQQEIAPGFSTTITYSHNWMGNILAQVNQAVSASDFTSYCVTAPTDARLPGGGGYQTCGLFDVNPNKFGQVSNLLEPASALGVGDITRAYNGVDITLNGRFGKGGVVSGGVGVGRTVWDDCALNTLPQAFTTGGGFINNSVRVTLDGALHPKTSDYCHVAAPWSQSTQIKFTAVYPLPWGFDISGVFQNLPGVPDSTTGAGQSGLSGKTYTNAEIAPSLGRNLSSGAAGTVVIPVLPPYTRFEDRLTQVDFRIAKMFRLPGTGRVKATLDLYNMFNANTITRINATYGAAWLNATQIMNARFVRLGAQVDF